MPAPRLGHTARIVHDGRVPARAGGHARWAIVLCGNPRGPSARQAARPCVACVSGTGRPHDDFMIMNIMPGQTDSADRQDIIILARSARREQANARKDSSSTAAAQDKKSARARMGPRPRLGCRHHFGDGR